MHFDLNSRPKTRRSGPWAPVWGGHTGRPFRLRAASAARIPVSVASPGFKTPPPKSVVTKAAVAGLSLMLAVSAFACSVPVFRYALERWPADPYHAAVFHRGPLTPAQQAVAAKLGGDGLAGEKSSNLETHLIDLDADPQPEWVGLWEAQKTGTLPWLAVMYPPVSSVPVPLTAGPLETQSIEELVDSPARAEIARRLIGGETAVWVLLEIGDPAGDNAAAARLDGRLKHLMQTLQLPTLEKADIESGLVSVSQDELKVQFSVIRISRDDPAEKLFTAMLLGTEEDLKGLKQPMAFPVFGRGRALYALVGDGINHQTIDDACAFLVGACSCEVKELNPGVDLLISAAWDKLVKSSINTEQEIPELSGLIGFEEPPAATGSVAPSGAAADPVIDISSAGTEPGGAPPPAGPNGSSLTGRLLLVGAAGLLVVLAASVFLLFRKS